MDKVNITEEISAREVRVQGHFISPEGNWPRTAAFQCSDIELTAAYKFRFMKVRVRMRAAGPLSFPHVTFRDCKK